MQETSLHVTLPSQTSFGMQRDGASLLSPNTFLLGGGFACKGLIKNNWRESSPKQCPQSAPIHNLFCSSRRQHKVIHILKNVHSLPMIVIQTHQNQIRKKGEKVTRPWAQYTHIFILSETRIIMCLQFCNSWVHFASHCECLTILWKHNFWWLCATP